MNLSDLSNIDDWFPFEVQRKYISQLQGQVGLTRRRAEYFVKLWAYLYVKQQDELGKRPRLPLTHLDLIEGFIPCTHREAQELFYANSDRGSDRAAGMMIDKLVGLGLIEKNFDGNTVCIRIRATLPNIKEVKKSKEILQLIPDAFNSRTDAVLVANFLARYYNWVNKSSNIVSHRIARVLRFWATQYPAGMRVLRHPETQNPVAFYILYPIAPECEEKLFLPPSRSLYLNTESEIDPWKIATLGDLECTALHVRGWQIDFPYKNENSIKQLLRDAQKTLVTLQADFPNLCDIYALPMHPADQQLVYALGFQSTIQDTQRLLSWMYMPLDKFMLVDIDQVVSNLSS